MTSSIDQLTEVFRKEKGFERLFSLFFEKYRSYERLQNNISVTLGHPSPEERKTIGGLLGEDYSRNKSIRITASKFEKGLRNTKYADFIKDHTLLDIVEAYYGLELVSKKQEKDTFLMERTACLEGYKQKTSSIYFLTLVQWMQNEENEQNRYFQLYRQDLSSFARLMDQMLLVCEALPLQEYTYLPVLAANITNDPHAFDMNIEQGKFLIYTLQILQWSEGPIKFDLNAEQTTELLYEFNIMRDDLLNYVTLFNVKGVLHSGQESLLLKGAREDQASFHLPLREVVKLKEVHACSAEPIIYMIENSSVTSHVINKVIQDHKNCSIISGNGMLKLATLRLLDLFIENGGMLYYAGDFDPEGLGIAQKLLRRYPNRVKLWMYEAEQYKKSISEKIIDPSRLKQLSQIDHLDLLEVKNEMMQQQKAGYQENILNELLDNIS